MSQTYIINDEVYYHIYNRGAHKAEIFLDNDDYIRMVKLLYIANNDHPFIMTRTPTNIYNFERKDVLVDIVAYCLMPNHIHIAIKKPMKNNDEKWDNVTRFIHKLTTGYTTYFNKKYRHSGTIWQGSYKEKTVYDGLYIETLINYIHLNPCDLMSNINTIDSKTPQDIYFALNYNYSSMKDYEGMIRPERAILNEEAIQRFHMSRLCRG